MLESYEPEGREYGFAKIPGTGGAFVRNCGSRDLKPAVASARAPEPRTELEGISTMFIRVK